MLFKSLIDGIVNALIFLSAMRQALFCAVRFLLVVGDEIEVGLRRLALTCISARKDYFKMTALAY